jgi:energy-coupling factor transporter ATP-binding protein EcfA2
MRLRAAQIKHFKLIQDGGRFRVDDLTCLVGKNESGKTAVLKALHRLNPDDPDEADFDVETEYPRHQLFDYKARHATDPEQVVTSWWSLSEAEAQWITSRFGESALVDREVVVERGYENINQLTANIDEAAAIRHLVDTSGLDGVDVVNLRTVPDTSALVTKVKALAPSSQRDAFVEQLRSLVDDNTVGEAVHSYLSTQLPTFVYYANYYTLPGQMSLDHFIEVEERQELKWPEKIFKALLSLVGSSAQEISEKNTYEALKADLEAIGLRLSHEIFEYWSQNSDLSVDFNFDRARPGDPAPYDRGYVFRTRIRNHRHGVSVSFDERSTGFVWFFSFLVWFSQMQREHGENLVLLLDEPGLSLHGTAQSDLLRYIKEKLAPKHQVIYSTHSPFMVDTGDMRSVRTVEDVMSGNTALGTNVGDEVLSTDGETLFPLRAALGYDVTQTMFVGENCLLVDAPSDLLYLQWASEELRTRGRTGLDPRWVVTPCGGIRKVGSFLSLFGAHHLHVAVLTNLAAGERASVRSIREKRMLRDGQVLTADMFLDGQHEADIEDLLGRGLYKALVSATFALPHGQRLERISGPEAPARVVQEVEDHFKLLPSDAPQFNRFSPAPYLLQHHSDFAGHVDLDSALDRFERIFTTLQGFL